MASAAICPHLVGTSFHPRHLHRTHTYRVPHWSTSLGTCLMYPATHGSHEMEPPDCCLAHASVTCSECEHTMVAGTYSTCPPRQKVLGLSRLTQPLKVEVRATDSCSHPLLPTLSPPDRPIALQPAPYLNPHDKRRQQPLRPDYPLLDQPSSSQRPSGRGEHHRLFKPLSDPSTPGNRSWEYPPDTSLVHRLPCAVLSTLDLQFFDKQHHCRQSLLYCPTP